MQGWAGIALILSCTWLMWQLRSRRCEPVVLL
jgi:hypothetical protein